MSSKEMSELMDQLFTQAQMQFGAAIKGRWMHDGDMCPGCGKPISSLKWKGKDAMSLNAFIYREHGVLIAYLLCGKCARKIFRNVEQNPYDKSSTPLHLEIEKTLKQAFVKQLGH